MSFFSSGASTANTAPLGDVSHDVEVQHPPTDSISSLAFSPAGQVDLLAVGSWDNAVRGYEVGQGGVTQGKFIYTHDQPVLSVCWSRDGTKLFSSGADKVVKLYDLATGQSTQVGGHDEPVRVVRWIDQVNLLVSGGWDKTIKYWDLRSPQAIGSIALSHKVYALDTQSSLLAIATGDRQISMVHLGNPGVIFRTIPSPLKQQTRCLTCFPSGDGFALGSIEGRVAIQNVEEKNAGSNYSFRCHRSSVTVKGQDDVYSVNDIKFHPTQGTFSTAGADGGFTFWDKDARSRLKSFEAAKHPISATAFNANGSIYAYSVSFDWSTGHMGNVPGHPNKIMLHPIKEDEVRKRPVKK